MSIKFPIHAGLPQKKRTACLVLGVFLGGKLSPAAQTLDLATNGALSNIVRRGDMHADIGSHLLLHDIPGCLAQRILLIGCGKKQQLSMADYIDIQKNAYTALQAINVAKATSYLTQLSIKGHDTYDAIRTAIEATHYAHYQYDAFKKPKHPPKLKKLTLTVAERNMRTKAKQVVQQGTIIAEAIAYCRELANAPPNVCTPEYLTQQAKHISKEYEHVQCKILDEAALQQQNMHSLLAVGRGSTLPSYLIELHYHGTKQGVAPIVLVGKGVTFDAGGLSLKPAANMTDMKTDMCGAASVLSALQAIAALQLPLNVIAVVPTVENMPDGNAYRPSDIITTKSGKTVEILNTDAEGRMILCDALTHVEQFNPTAVIDVATLTGSIVVALGREYNGLYGNHMPLVHALLKAGENAHDEAWHMPMHSAYFKQMESHIADLKNAGGAEAGSITAACFLANFATRYHWAHLDIAGTSRSKTKAGVTGRPTALLIQYCIQQAQQMHNEKS